MWHLNYILPPSDKGNQEQRGLASTTWTPECGPIISRQVWSHKRSVHGVLSLLLFTTLGDTANMVNSQRNCSIRGWKTSPAARRSTLCRSAQSTGPFAISWPLLKASSGNTQRDWKGALKLGILIPKFHCEKSKCCYLLRWNRITYKSVRSHKMMGTKPTINPQI